MADSSPLLRPTPRRPFDLTPASTGSSEPPTPPAVHEYLESPQPDSRPSPRGEPPSRTRSILNLTSSTLFGIYTPEEGSSTPWGTGAQTPSLRASNDDKRPPVMGAYERPQLHRSLSQQYHVTARNTFIPLALRTTLLFLLGITYGLIVIHLHDDRKLAPVGVEGIERYSWWYLTTWGVAGVLLGSLLPWVDTLWEETMENYEIMKAAETQTGDRDRRPSTASSEGERPRFQAGNDFSANLTPVIRGMGAFFGIAFAIRKLPWESTMQVSLTLALVNPVLWYLVDRSRAGFLLSSIVGIAGTAVCLRFNPNLLPSPAAAPISNSSATDITYQSTGRESIVSIESFGVGTWIASVLFCSCVCFGNIGRRLALGYHGQRGTTSST